MREVEASFKRDISRNNDKQDQKFGEELKRLEGKIVSLKNQPGNTSLEERMRELGLGGINTKDSKENAPAPTPSSMWMPRHIILGGWNSNTERVTMEHEARAWYNALLRNIQDKCLEPYAPRKLGDIAKMRVQHGHINDWALPKMTEKQDKAIRPSWTAIERSQTRGDAGRTLAQRWRRP